MFLSSGLMVLTIIIGVFSVDGAAYMKLGDKVVLSPNFVSVPITSITWKHGPDIAVEWYGDQIDAYRECKGLCELDFPTGALTILNLTVKDSGTYTAEINNQVMSPIEITVISAVSKPTVSKSCNTEMTICTLTCEAHITDDTRPVTCSWVIGARQTAQSASNQLNITKDDTEWYGKPISCQLNNPVSSERSDIIIIPVTNRNLPIMFTRLVFIVLLIVVALSGFFIWHKHIKANAETLAEDQGMHPGSSNDPSE